MQQAASTPNRQPDKLAFMCLILFAYQHHPDFPLIVAANRDEFYERPTRSPHYWEDHPEIFAGRDLQAGGTWMGVSKHGRFAAVTNYREPREVPVNAISRGALCTHFLNGDMSINEYLKKLDEQRQAYAGFNLLTGDFSDPDNPRLGYFSNRQTLRESQLEPGIYGLSNGLLNEPWPKVLNGTKALKQKLHDSAAAIQTILLDDKTAPPQQLPDTGIEKTLELQLSSRFINIKDYGTRSTTVLRINSQGTIEWRDQSFGQHGALDPPQVFNIPITGR